MNTTPSPHASTDDGTFPAASGDDRLRIHRVARDRPLPLSLAQERFWVLHKMDPSSPADNVAVALRIEGDFRTDLYLQTWEHIVSRHEILRTRFVALPDGTPTQVVDPPRRVDVTCVDCRDASDPAPEAAAMALAAADADKPFDLETGPVFRLCLYRIADDSTLLLAVFHHIVCDLWSIGVLSYEFAETYSALLEGRVPILPKLPFQYADYAVCHRRWAEGPAVQPQLDYWTRQLAGARPTELPADRRRSQRPGRGASGSVRLPDDLMPEIKKLAGGAGATPFMVLMAAFVYLLSRYTGQDDVVVGTPIANRTRLSLKALVGTFVNTLVFRVNVGGTGTFQDLLERVRQVAVDAFANQDITFHRLVHYLKPERSSGNGVFFHVMLNVQNAPVQIPKIPGLTITPVVLQRRASQFDLTVSVDPDLLRNIGFSYDTSLFDASTIESFTARYLHLLERVVKDPAAPLSAIDLLLPDERDVILHRWNATQRDVPNGSFLELFHEQAARNPNKTAVEGDGHSLSYAELDRLSMNVAAHLKARGVGRDSVVAVCVSRSPALLATLLGALKAGAAYLPLDSAYPDSRISYLLRDSGAALVVREPGVLSQVRADVPTVDIADLLQPTAACPLDTPRPGDLAYVIYTSGSTGQPKGVEVTHGALANFLLAMRERPGIQVSDRLLAITTVTFDISGLELYLPLTVGATVVMATREDAIDPVRLAKLMDTHDISIVQATPTTWRMLIDSGWTGRPSLKILCGGEALSRELANRLLRRAREVWNLYGPTETTIWSSVEKVRSGQDPITVGRPIANTQFYVLDREQQPVPPGVRGELYIGGGGLARGYRNRADLTAARFVPNPFAQDAGARMYRTGDVARYLPDGRVELLGRSDHQVKVRGFRVELAEIEAVLNGIVGVSAGVVVARSGDNGLTRLVAYVVPADPSTTSERIRAALARQLPQYMIPSQIVLVDKLPLLLSGKIDRTAVLDLALERGRDVIVPPATETERRIAQIWEEELRLDDVSVTDDFFDLGGDSLLAVRIAARVVKELGRSIDVATVHGARTIRQLACEIERAPLVRKWFIR